MKNILFLVTLGVSIVSCSTSDNDFCECDYFTRDSDVKTKSNSILVGVDVDELTTFKADPLTGNVCDMLGRNGILIENVMTYEDGMKVHYKDYYLDGKTLTKEGYMEEGKSITIEYFLTGVISSKNIFDEEGNRISGEEYWYNGNLKEKNDYVNKKYQNYNSLGELIEE